MDFPDIRSFKPKCHFVHHFNPFLKISPFLLEVKFHSPVRTIFHDIFFTKEIDWIIKHVKPKLTKLREDVSRVHDRQRDSDLVEAWSKNVFAVKLATTTTFRDIKYNEKERYYKTNSDDRPLAYSTLPLKNPYGFEIEHMIMLKISRRIELATNLNLTTLHGSSEYQATNYGLSGMTVAHQDPLGYESGVPLIKAEKSLIRSGDYIGTFMGCLDDTTAGGKTAFTSKQFEGIDEPKKGSAAFWINLSSCHQKDYRSTHVGCPVLKGSKWILNKWAYSWDQSKKWPCKLYPMISMSPFNGMSV